MAHHQAGHQPAEWRLSALPPMSDAEFALWARLLEKRTGITLPESRKSFLVTAFGPRMRELGIGDYEGYYQYVTSGRRGALEWTHLVDRLTVHETRFFRHESSLALVRDVYLRELDADARGGRRSVDLWSVGCATGEEPYSLAMVVDQYLAERGGDWYFGVTASDISLPALAVGRDGIYSRAKLKDVPSQLLMRYFEPLDGERFQVRPRLRERMCFTRINVLELDHAPVGMMDVIVCQNLLIYFQRERRIAALNHLVEHLRPGGLLVLGAGEIMGWDHPALEPVLYENTLAFRRVRDGAQDEV